MTAGRSIGTTRRGGRTPTRRGMAPRPVFAPTTAEESSPMSVIRVGSNSKYADGWSHVFGGVKAGGKKAAKKVAKKAAKKKASAKKKR